MAAELGSSLIAEIEEVALDELLHDVQLRLNSKSALFGFEYLDELINALTSTQTSSIKAQLQPVIEIGSPSPGGGKKHLLYHLVALALLPRVHGGKQATVAIVDTDATFSVPRLVQQIRLVLAQSHPDDHLSKLDETVETALQHVHLFYPQSLASTVTTLNAIPDYLFHGDHFSLDRSLAFVTLTSASSFYWQTKAAEEDAAFHAKTSPSTSPASDDQVTSYAQLAAALRSVSRILNTPIIFTSWNLNPPNRQQQPGETSAAGPLSLRPSLPAPVTAMPTIRLLVQRVPVRKFPPSISVIEAMREAPERLRAVEVNRFECVVNEWGMNAKTLAQIGGVRTSFTFRIREEGLLIDRRMEEQEGDTAG